MKEDGGHWVCAESEISGQLKKAAVAENMTRGCSVEEKVSLTANSLEGQVFIVARLCNFNKVWTHSHGWPVGGDK